MAVPTTTTVKKLKEIIDKNGLSYMTDEPYQVYKELLESKAADRKTAGAFLHALVNGMQIEAEKDGDIQRLSSMIKRECSFNKAMADRISGIFSTLYSPDNKAGWEKEDKEGLAQFLKEEFSLNWKGFAVWDAGNGTVDCHYEADIVLMPMEAAVEDKKLKRLLEKNPFMSKESIREYFAKGIKEYLDREFGEYCTEDDYYQPVVEDFGINLEYDLKEWCKKNGFEFVSCEGDGDDSGYEPKFRRGWY